MMSRKMQAEVVFTAHVSECWSVSAPGSRARSARRLARRLRRIGDELEMPTAHSDDPREVQPNTGDPCGNTWRSGMTLFSIAVHVTGLVLLLAGKRHL